MTSYKQTIEKWENLVNAIKARDWKLARELLDEDCHYCTAHTMSSCPLNISYLGRLVCSSTGIPHCWYDIAKMGILYKADGLDGGYRPSQIRRAAEIVLKHVKEHAG